MGDENSLNGMATASLFAASLLNRGTKTMTRQQIKDELDQLKARVSFNGSGGTVTASIQSTKENLPAVIKMVTDMLKNPIFPEKEFEELKNEQLAGIEEQRSDPQAMVGNAFSRHLNPYPKNDIRYVMTPDEEIAAVKSLKLDEVKKFHSEFYGANNATVSVVGDFNEVEIKHLVKSELGQWKS